MYCDGVRCFTDSLQRSTGLGCRVTAALIYSGLMAQHTAIAGGQVVHPGVLSNAPLSTTMLLLTPSSTGHWHRVLAPTPFCASEVTLLTIKC